MKTYHNFHKNVFCIYGAINWLRVFRGSLTLIAGKPATLRATSYPARN
jgi:hypothetical protein